MSNSLSDLPDDVRQAIAPHADAPSSVARRVRCEDRCQSGKRPRARSRSGIESTWTDCEEAYLGIDEANRHEFVGARWAKPMSMDGPVATGKK